MRDHFESLEKIFHPKNVAVLGVSKSGFGFGSGILSALRSIGFEGNLYPVNRSGGEIGGLKIHPTVEDIPETIDFAIIAVPAPFVPEALDACRKKGAVGAEILSSGFKEVATEEGLELDRQLKEAADRGIRILGPNCFGIYCPKSGLTFLPGPDLSRVSGPVAFTAQSGGLAIDFGYIGKWRGIRFSKMVSFGNGCDLRETELLEYFRHDPETKVICMYIEGVDDGRRFFEELRKTTMEKPVIIMKGGLSESGGRAVTSHTASMGGSRVIWESLLRQCNAVQVSNLQEMADAALAFSMLPLEEYKGVAAVGGGGALGVNAADMAETVGLSIPLLREDLQEKINPILPQPGSSPANPIDIANPFTPPDVLRDSVIHAAEDENIDIFILTQLLYSFKAIAMAMNSPVIRPMVPMDALLDACQEAEKQGGKPLVMVLPNHKQESDALEIEEVIREVRDKFIAADIPVFDQAHQALRAIAKVSQYVARRNRRLE